MGQEVATQPKAEGNTGVAVYDYGQYVGAGFENTSAADFKPSFLKTLQGGSPELETVPGAKPGVILDSITKEIYSEVQMIVAFQEHVYAAWKPRDPQGGRSGGDAFGGIYQLNDPSIQAALASVPDKFARDEASGKIILPEFEKEGEVFQLIETRYYHGLQVLDGGALVPVTVPFTSTGLPAAGDWLNIMNRQKVPGTNKEMPMFAHVFKLSVIKKESGSYRWWLLVPSWANGDAVKSRLAPDSEAFKSAAKVYEAFKAGNAKVDYAKAGAGETAEKAKGKPDAEVPF